MPERADGEHRQEKVQTLLQVAFHGHDRTARHGLPQWRGAIGIVIDVGIGAICPGNEGGSAGKLRWEIVLLIALALLCWQCQ